MRRAQCSCSTRWRGDRCASINSICGDTGQSPVTVATTLGRLAERLGLVRELTGRRRNRVFDHVAYPDAVNREALFDAGVAAAAAPL